MNRDEFCAQFHQLTLELDEYGIRSTQPFTQTELEQIQELLQADFPDDYIWFLRNYWTGIFGSLDLYTMERGGRSSIVERQPPATLGRYVAIADDGFGNAYCFPVQGKKCRDEIVVVPLLASEFTGKAEYAGFLEFVSATA